MRLTWLPGHGHVLSVNEMDESCDRTLPAIVTHDEWERTLRDLTVQEKALTRLGDLISAQRRRLPMVGVRNDYLFTGVDGAATLLDLFDGRQQLIVYHFMFAADQEAGCEGCSWVVDAMSHPEHLRARNTSIIAASIAPLEKLQTYRQRMGWTDLDWYSSAGSDFNVDMGATVGGQEHHGVSVFIRDGNEVYRTYYSGDRGVEHLGSHWTYLDLTPFGRQETWEDSPAGRPQNEAYAGQRRHDEYDEPEVAADL